MRRAAKRKQNAGEMGPLVPVDEARDPEPMGLVRFGLEWMQRQGWISGHSSKDAWISAFKSQIDQRQNAFELGRLGTMKQLRCNEGLFHPMGDQWSNTVVEHLMLRIWDEFTEVHKHGNHAHTERSLKDAEQQGFECYWREALMGYARLVRKAPSKIIKSRFIAAAKKEWKFMNVRERLLWATVAAAQRPKPEPLPPRSSGSRGRVPLLPDGWRPPPDIYHRGSDVVFAHARIQSLLQHARQRVSMGQDWVFCIRTYSRSGFDSNGKETKATRNGGIMNLTLKLLKEQGLLDQPSFRQRLHIFVAHSDPHFLKGYYKKALGSLADRIIVGVKGADLQVRFIEECFLPGQHVVVADDNIVSLEEAPPDVTDKDRPIPELLPPPDLPDLVAQAAAAMQKHRGHLWSIAPTYNKLFLLGAQPINMKLGLTFGALFGFIALHEHDLYSQHGQVKDDVERSVRYFHRDKVLIKMGRVGAQKNFKPGVFNAKKGGISASLGTEDKHTEEAQQALEALVKEFGRYIQFPTEGKTQRKGKNSKENSTKGKDGEGGQRGRHSKCGVVFQTSQPALTQVPEGKALAVGFRCRLCRTDGAKVELPAHCTCVRPTYEEAKNIFSKEAQNENRSSKEIEKKFQKQSEKDPSFREHYQTLAAQRLAKLQVKSLRRTGGDGSPRRGASKRPRATDDVERVPKKEKKVGTVLLWEQVSACKC